MGVFFGGWGGWRAAPCTLLPGCPEGSWLFERFGALSLNSRDLFGKRARRARGLGVRQGTGPQKRVRTAGNASFPRRERGGARGPLAALGGSWRLSGRPKSRGGLGGAARACKGDPTEMRRHAFCGAWPKGARGALAARCGGGRRGRLKSRRCGGGPQGSQIFNAPPGHPGDRVK